MSRVKIEDLDPGSRELDLKEMKSLFGGLGTVQASQDGTLIHHDADGILWDGTQSKFYVDSTFGKVMGAQEYKDSVNVKLTR